MIKQWHVLQPNPGKVDELSRALGCHRITATVLINRGIETTADAAKISELSLGQLRSPFGLKGMDGAVQRITTALTGGQKILVFGDYDVDGVTATAVLIEFLRAAGARASAYIPDRREDGYGLKPRHVRNQAAAAGIDLIITADCGSNDRAAIAEAAKAGIDVVITDHHLIEPPQLSATAMVNPQQAESEADFEYLSGVGVAFFLVMALRKTLRDQGFWHKRPEPNLKRLCDLVALGTVADIVPLNGENRVLTRVGLELINFNHRPGLAALREIAGLGDKPVDTEDIAFRLAPRINAAGRIGNARTALELLLTDNRQEAAKGAQKLNELNATRQQLERDVTSAILSHLAHHPDYLQKRVLVLGDSDWHEGILGIAASKIVNQFYRPVILLNLHEGIAKGSARSIPGVDMFKALTACRQWLDSFGGHSQAAGLSLPAANIDKFRDDLDQVLRHTAQPNTFIPKLTLDGELNFSDISRTLVDEIEGLKPFGANHQEPLFMAREVAVTSSQIVGRHHRRMTLGQSNQEGRHRVAAIHFNPDRQSAAADRFERVAFRLRRNVWKGKTTLQLVVEEAQTQSERSIE